MDMKYLPSIIVCVQTTLHSPSETISVANVWQRGSHFRKGRRGFRVRRRIQGLVYVVNIINFKR